MVPMTVCHLLLGRPWQYDRDVRHNGRTNTYQLNWQGKEILLRPLMPQDIVNDSRQKAEVHREAETERLASRETTPSVRESHQPNLSGKKTSEGAKKLVMLATKSDLREFREDPTLVPLVLMCKGEILVSNDMTRISLGVSHVL